MLCTYQKDFRTNRISFDNLRKAIQSLYSEQETHKLLIYDEILFIFDKKCKAKDSQHYRKITEELFQQTCNYKNQSTIASMINAYIQNLQTSKLCILRDQKKIEELKITIGNIPERQNTFVYFKMEQISVFSRFTGNSICQYHIEPSDIPPIMFHNTLNHTPNHQFTLQLQSDHFSITFYQSGIQIFKWNFPDVPSLEEGDYFRSVKSENLQFDIKLKYMPKHKSKAKRQLQNQKYTFDLRLQNQFHAFSALCNFTPFLKPIIAESQQQYSGCIGTMLHLIPFLKHHIINLYYLLVLLIIAQCFSAFYSPIEWLDLILSFYTLSLLYDINLKQQALHRVFLFVFIAFVLCIGKTFWGIAIVSIYQNYFFHFVGIAVCLFLKVLILFAIIICFNRLGQISQQRMIYLTDPEGKQQAKLMDNQQNQIYQE